MTVDAAYLHYAHRRAAMDHDRYGRDNVFAREPLRWPAGARVALWLVPLVEFFPLDMPLNAAPGGMTRPYPDYWNYTLRDYGNRVGIYRILRALDERGFRASVAFNSRLLELARADVARLGEDVTGVEEVVAGTLERFRLSGLSVNAAVEDRGIRVRMSAEVLEEILGNLLDNARLHGGPHVSVRITARRSTRSNPRAIEILVEDNGPGISEGNAPRVFTPFFTTARERGGSGLGLSIVQALVNAHGGSIVLEPRAPGAAFRVVLPEAEMP